MSETRDFEWDVMLDLETLGTAPNAPIIAIGAWPFRLDNESVPFGYFYRNVDAGSSVAVGLVPDGGLFYWWLQQSEEARLRLSEPKPVSLNSALWGLWNWLEAIGGEEKAFRLWAHGTNSDLPILESAYRAMRFNGYPWRYNAARDTRTLFHAVCMDWGAEFEAMRGTKYDALAGARAQATLVKRAWRRLERHAFEAETRRDE